MWPARLSLSSAPSIALADSLCPPWRSGPAHLSGLLCASGQQFHVWSAAYRLFEKQRIDPSQLCKGVPSQVFTQDSAPVVALIDDTLCRKRGKHISGPS